MKLQIRNILGFFFLTVLLLSGNINASAQHVLESSIDSIRVEVGNPTTLRLQIMTSQDEIVYWPTNLDGIHLDIDVLRYEKLDTVVEGEMLHLEQRIKIAAFDTGYHAIAPLPVIVRGPQGIDTIFSEPMLLEVYGPQQDTSIAFKPIKPIKQEPYTLKEILNVAMWIYFGISALILLIWFIRKLIKRESIISPIVKPKVPAHIEAKQKLDKLDKKRLWQSGEIKLYYTELTDIIRHYMDRELEIPAPEATSDQIIEYLEKEAITAQLFQGLKNLFKTADFVKFAKMQPNDDDNEIHIKTAYRFVEEVHQKMLVEQENSQAK
jgi:hypothetical protein